MNIGLVDNITDYYKQHCAADYTILVTDKDQFIDAAPIVNAIQKLDSDTTLSMVVIPIRQNDDGEEQLLTFDYPRMSGSDFIKHYIDDTTLQHCMHYGVVRVAAVKKAGVPRPLNLRAFGLEDSFGFDLDFFLMIAATGDVTFEKQPHICRTILAGLTERFPLSFAYCYYQYAKRTLKELYQKKVITRKDVRKSISWWNLLMLRGLVVVYQPSDRRTEVDTSRIKHHLKIPVWLYLLIQYIQYQIWPTEEMKKLLYMQYLEDTVRFVQQCIGAMKGRYHQLKAILLQFLRYLSE